MQSFGEYIWVFINSQIFLLILGATIIPIILRNWENKKLENEKKHQDSLLMKILTYRTQKIIYEFNLIFQELYSLLEDEEKEIINYHYWPEEIELLIFINKKTKKKEIANIQAKYINRPYISDLDKNTILILAESISNTIYGPDYGSKYHPILPEIEKGQTILGLLINILPSEYIQDVDMDWVIEQFSYFDTFLKEIIALSNDGYESKNSLELKELFKEYYVKLEFFMYVMAIIQEISIFGLDSDRMGFRGNNN